jgi:hypothetical protein
VERAGGADRDRTDDLLNANQALSQLSYSPLIPNRRARKLVGFRPGPEGNSSRPIGCSADPDGPDLHNLSKTRAKEGANGME